MSNDGRINLRLPPELIEWVKEYCTRTGVSMSGLVRVLLMQEKTKDSEKAIHVDAEQI
jgi:predicted DNA binding CopG/RHH family protein